MRKFFSIVLYVFAGMFLLSIVMMSFINTPKVNLSTSEIIIMLFVILSMTMFFFLLASLLYPNKNYYKPMYITILSSTVMALFSGINQYFVMQGFKNSDINTSMTEVFKNDTFSYDLTIGVSVSISFLLMALYFFVLSNNIEETALTRKKWSPFFISFAIIFLIVYVSGKFFG